MRELNNAVLVIDIAYTAFKTNMMVLLVVGLSRSLYPKRLNFGFIHPILGSSLKHIDLKKRLHRATMRAFFKINLFEI